MQRWIIAAGVFLVLLAGGSAFGYRAYRLNRAIHPVLLQFPVPGETTQDERNAAAKLLRHKLSEAALLAQVSRQAGLARKLNLASDESAASDLGKRLFVEVGEADLPQGRLAVIKIGANCTVGEYNAMVCVSEQLRKALEKP